MSDGESRYGRYQVGLLPGWLQECGGGKLASAFGDEKSHQLDLVRQALLADSPRPPSLGDPGSTTDALKLIGADRMLPRKQDLLGTPLESDAEYAERLRTCWDAPDGHKYHGTHRGMLLALARAGFPVGLARGAVIIQRTRRYSYISDTTGEVVYGLHDGWTFNHEGPEKWNQFGIMFGADLGLIPNVPAGRSDAGTPILIDGSQAAVTLNSIVNYWKPAKARYMGARVVVSGSVWGWPFGVTWGQAGRTWGGVVRFITPRDP